MAHTSPGSDLGSKGMDYGMLVMANVVGLVFTQAPISANLLTSNATRGSGFPLAHRLGKKAAALRDYSC